MSAAKARAPRKAQPAPKDVIALLKADHEAVSQLFTGYENTRSIAQLEGVEPIGEMYVAKVKVLSEYVKHHVKEEQNEMFPKAKASSLDMVELGASMAARKDDLLAQAAATPG